MEIALSNHLKLEILSLSHDSEGTRQKLRWYDPMKRRRYARKTPGIDNCTGDGCLGSVCANRTL